MSRKSASILIADDDQDVCSVLSMFLTAQGHKVTEANDGDQAWKMLQKSPPDLAVLDIMMPGTSGLDVCRKMREHPVLRTTPVIMISALARREDVINGFRAGATDYITKPFVNAEVLARIRSVLRRFDLLQERRRNWELTRFNEQLRHILNEIGIPIQPLIRNLKSLRDLSLRFENEHRSCQIVYQQGLRTFMILSELQQKRDQLRDIVLES
jgi:DNA-binding response OmpR family regulator